MNDVELEHKAKMARVEMDVLDVIRPLSERDRIKVLVRAAVEMDLYDVAIVGLERLERMAAPEPCVDLGNASRGEP